MSDVQTLIDFGGWTIKHYPAKKYALVLWNHGGGWRNGSNHILNSLMPFGLLGSQLPSAGFREFSTDETNHPDDPYAAITLSNGDYSKALAAIAGRTQNKKIDLVGFDACLMGMYEVAAATEGYADYLVASPRGVPGYGWDYSTVIGALTRKPEMEARELGEIITDSYIKEYENEPDMEVVMGLYDMSAMNELSEKLDEFGRAMLNAIRDEHGNPIADNIRTIRELSKTLTRFEYPDHADLKSLADAVANAETLPQDVRTKAQALSAQFDLTIAEFGQSRLPDDHGMGIFFPVMFNCCMDDNDNLYTVSTREEFEACPIYPYSSFLCEEQNGIYMMSDVLAPTTTSQWVEFVGDYYAAAWWKTDLDDLTAGWKGWRDFLSVYYDLLFDVDTENDFINIPAGSFTLSHDTGSYSSGDTVTLAAFKLGKTPVTVAEFKKCVEAGKCTAEHYATSNATNHCNYGDDSKADHPMNCVEWYGAKEYCEWNGGRLPTEEEWEYAATHNDTEHLNMEYPWGNDAPQHCVTANYSGSASPYYCNGRVETSSEVGTSEVGTYSPAGDSPLGLVDMSGNVWEWTSSLYFSEGSTRALKGGSWDVSGVNLRVTARSSGDPASRYYGRGGVVRSREYF